MIVKAGEADRFAANPPKGLRVALVFGPDAGLVQERAEKLLKSVTPDLTDPFNVADLNESVLLADPARLADEAAAISMMGGNRVVRIRGAGNNLAALLEEFLEDPAGDALVVLEGATLPRARACANCSRKTTRLPPLPAIPTMRAAWKMWCVKRCGQKG